MDSFEDIHRRHITGSLAMFDRMIFKVTCRICSNPTRCGPSCGPRVTRSPTSPSTPRPRRTASRATSTAWRPSRDVLASPSTT